MENKHLNEALNEAGKLIKTKLKVAASKMVLKRLES